MKPIKNDVKTKKEMQDADPLPPLLVAKLKSWLSSKPQAEMAALLGVSVPTVQRMASGASPLTVGKLMRLSDVVGVPVEQMLSENPSEPIPEGGIPIHDVSFSAGGGTEIILSGESDQKAMFPVSWLRQQFGKIDNLRMVRVAGDSMHPTISDGEWVIIDLDRTSGPGIFAIRLYDQVYIKRLQFQSTRVLAISDNPSHEVFVINLKDRADREAFQVIGRVVWTGKML